MGTKIFLALIVCSIVYSPCASMLNKSSDLNPKSWPSKYPTDYHIRSNGPVLRPLPLPIDQDGIDGLKILSTDAQFQKGVAWYSSRIAGKDMKNEEEEIRTAVDLFTKIGASCDRKNFIEVTWNFVKSPFEFFIFVNNKFNNMPSVVVGLLLFAGVGKRFIKL
jgi:hypothetical protein